MKVTITTPNGTKVVKAGDSAKAGKPTKGFPVVKAGSSRWGRWQDSRHA